MAFNSSLSFLYSKSKVLGWKPPIERTQSSYPKEGFPPNQGSISKIVIRRRNPPKNKEEKSS
jgi:hypothetical protein